MRKLPRNSVRTVIIALIVVNILLLILTKHTVRNVFISIPPSKTKWICAKPATWPACMPPDRKHIGNPIRIMCMGDSITFGNGNLTLAFGSYREPLRRLLGRPVIFVGEQRCGYPLVAPNEGYPSWGLGDIAGIAQKSAATEKPDIVLFMAGVNDLNSVHNESIDTALGYEADCIRNISLGAPTARIYVATLTPVRPNNYVSVDAAARLSARIPSVVARLQSEGINCHLVNMAQEVHLNSNEYDWMNIHPSDSGCVKEARVWAKAISPDL